MCGIFAYLSKKKITGALPLKLTKYSLKCKHRGPDNSISRLVDDYNFLMFHRLKINDTSDEGNKDVHDKIADEH